MRGAGGTAEEAASVTSVAIQPAGAPSAAGNARPKLVFLVTEDWFFVSHFLPMARAGRELGFDVVVVTRVRDHRAPIEATGARIVPLEAERRSLNPLAIAASIRRVADILRRERADILHTISLKPILVGGLAARLAGVQRRVYALTGLGFLGARQDVVGRAARGVIRWAMRGPLENETTRFVFENEDDAGLLGLAPDDARVAILGGAGVDPDVFVPAPQPPQPPLRVAVVARMLWSKGVDTAVEAVRLARGRGADIELSLYGAPDPSNPKAIPEATLRGWGAEPGIISHGRTSDIAGVWREHHVACLPSRGGEGLPRTLLEAAACGRAILTTDVPGCRRFVRSDREGYVVPPDAPAALAEALVRLAASPDLVVRLGEGARARLLDGFTERQVMERLKDVYRDLLPDMHPVAPVAAS